MQNKHQKIKNIIHKKLWNSKITN